VSDVFYLRLLDPPAAPADFKVLPESTDGCLKLHRVDWKHSYLAADGRRMLCWYTAPDAESVRLALRQLQANMDGLWAGSVYGDDWPGSPALADANFVAELRFPAPPGKGGFDAVAAALNQDGVTFVRGFAPTREAKCVCMVHAPGTRAVQTALRHADVSVDAIWPCTSITPPVPATQSSSPVSTSAC
jgi:hypothetical protein